MNRIPKAELKEMSARQRSNAVARWLESYGWNGLKDADGWPIVSRAWLADRMDGKLPEQEEYFVDVEALRAAPKGRK